MRKMVDKNMRSIETPRLVLRQLTAADSGDLLAFLGDYDTAWWADLPRFKDLDEVEDFIEWGNLLFNGEQYGICEKGSDRVVGLLQVSQFGTPGRVRERELGYILSKDFRGRGYMTEAVRAVCERLFSDGFVEEVSLEVLPFNLPSQGVARRCGFVLRPQPECEREKRFLDEEPLDCLVLTREAQRSLRAA